MVYLFGGCHPAFGIAPLTVGMGLEVFVTDPLPLTTVFLFHVRGSLVLIVLLPGQCSVFLTVGLVCQLRTAGVSAGALRFHGHGYFFFLLRKISRSLNLMMYHICSRYVTFL